LKYFTQLAVKGNKHAMCNGPKGAWEAMRMLEEGSTAHHCPPQNLHFCDPAIRNNATTPTANMEILYTHGHKV
jgi:hypothetical protein